MKKIQRKGWAVALSIGIMLSLPTLVMAEETQPVDRAMENAPETVISEDVVQTAAEEKEAEAISTSEATDSSALENEQADSGEEAESTLAEETAIPTEIPQVEETSSEDLEASSETEEKENAENVEVNLSVQEEKARNGFVKETVNGKSATRYYDNGKMILGQKKIGNYWYMFHPTTGVMQTGFYNHTTQTNPKGGAKTCYYDASGHMVYGQKKIGNYWYMFHPSSGAMIKGFYNHTTQTNPKGGAKTCYYDGNGHMIYGQKKIGNYWYMFHPSSGAMIKGFYNHTTKTNPKGGAKTCYYDASGHMVYGQKKIGNYWYMFHPSSGAMIKGFYNHTTKTNPKGGAKTCYYDTNGRLVYGQKRINGYWYMFTPGSGAMVTGLYTIPAQYNGGTAKTCYYNKKGQLQYGTHSIGGRTFVFNNKSGALEQVKFQSLSKLGISYSNSANAKVDKELNQMIKELTASEICFWTESDLDKASWIMLYIGSSFSYKDGSYSAESMIDKRGGTCYGYADLTYCFARKVGLTNTWLTVPGKNVDHDGKSYGSLHRTAVSLIGGKYYDLDSNMMSNNLPIIEMMLNLGADVDDMLMPEQIHKSYADYLRGISNSYTRIHP